jgi:hypothetical protein
VKLLRVENDRYFFRLGYGEKDLLEFLLRLYPMIPSAYQPLSKTSAKMDENQRLLDEALAEQRKENKQHVEELLNDAGRFKETHAAIEMNLTASEIEWLLQVLNDVYVGHWILLGSPEDQSRIKPTAQNAAYELTMDFASDFQMDLLKAIKHNA